MSTRWITVIVALFTLHTSAFAVHVESFSIGFHLIPAVQRIESAPSVDLAASFGLSLQLDPRNRLELFALVDSQPSSIGTSARFSHQAAEHLCTGFGASVFWPVSEELSFGSPILTTSAHAANRLPLHARVTAEAGVSVSLLALARIDARWRLLPPSELPALSLALDLSVAEQVIVHPRITVQPLLIDTTTLRNPIGRVSDHLLLLPVGSLFIRHLGSASPL